MIVFDTNVVSELMRSEPSPVVIGWVHSHPADGLYTTSITLAEIRYGIERLPDGRRKQLLRGVAEEVFADFAEKVLPFDAEAAVRYAAVVREHEEAGLPIEGFDAQIAAICRVHGATLATRHVKDFHGTGVTVVDPWREETAGGLPDRHHQ